MMAHLCFSCSLPWVLKTRDTLVVNKVFFFFVLWKRKWLNRLTLLRRLNWVRMRSLKSLLSLCLKLQCMCEARRRCEVKTDRWSPVEMLTRAPFPTSLWLCEQEMLRNAARWGHTSGIPALQLCCPVLLHSCACVRAVVGTQKVFHEGISYHRSLFCSCVRCWKCHHEIWQQGSFMSNNVVKNNGNKEAQSHMVMRLYFRAVAASVWNSELFSVVVRQKMSAWTGGCFSQAGKEVLWL